MSDMRIEMKFRSTLGGGYKKEDVNEYIANMQAEFNGIEETLKTTINHQKAELDALRATVEDAESRQTDLANATQAREAAEAACETLRARCAALDDENTALCAQLQALRTEAELAKAEETADAPMADGADGKAASAEEMAAVSISEKETVFPEDYEALKLKAEQYDRMSAHVGEIMLKANANAEEVVQKARKEAETLLAGVNAELIATRARAQNAADTLIDDVVRCVGEVSHTAKDALLADMEDLRARLCAMTEEIVGASTEIDRKIVLTKEQMQNAADGIIRDATTCRVLKK